MKEVIKQEVTMPIIPAYRFDMEMQQDITRSVKVDPAYGQLQRNPEEQFSRIYQGMEKHKLAFDQVDTSDTLSHDEEMSSADEDQPKKQNKVSITINQKSVYVKQNMYHGNFDSLTICGRVINI